MEETSEEGRAKVTKVDYFSGNSGLGLFFCPLITKDLEDLTINLLIL